jgi:hypothetical protein
MKREPKTSPPPAASNHETGADHPDDDCVMAIMRLCGMPMTRERYLEVAYMGSPPEELGAEEEANLPLQFQRGELRRLYLRDLDAEGTWQR